MHQTETDTAPALDKHECGSREFSVDQLKGKQLSPTFRPDALVVFRAK